MLKVIYKEIKITSLALIVVILLWAVSGFWIAKEAPVESFQVNFQIASEEDAASTEAVVRKCSSKQVFLKISQISQENTCVGISF